jgi:hypothetical protein
VTLAPIALFVYNRLWHLDQTVTSLRANDLARESELYVFSDAARDLSAQSRVEDVRSYLRSIDGFRSVRIIEADVNLGLAGSIIKGVTEICGSHGRVIVLEDDLVLSPYFLRFMNEALDYYANEERVISIHGYVYPVQEVLPESFFIGGADCWGWATWQRGWCLFEPDGAKLLRQLEERWLLDRFDLDGAYPYTDMLRGQIRGLNDSWAVRWYASALLNDKFTLYPGRSLVHNIGNDASGRHGANLQVFDTGVLIHPLKIGGIPVEESQEARYAFATYLRALKPSLPRRLLTRISRLFGKVRSQSKTCVAS